MSIYEKLSNVQLALMRKDIKKTGFNKFKKYHYYTLDDLMPPCIEECNREGLTFFFNFRNNEAIIRLHEWENPKEGISCGLPFPELITPDEDTKNKNNVLVQDLGAVVTYLKRYLLINLFDITDVEVIDSESNDVASSAKKQGNKSKSKPKQVAEKVEDVPVDLNVNELIIEAENVLKKKGLSGNEITMKAIKTQVLKLKKWNLAEKRVILKFFNEKEGASK